MSVESPSERSSGSRPLGLPDLIVFCEELAALLRARVPLSIGLTTGAFSSSAALEAAAAQLARQERLGRTLSEALQAESSTWPPVFRATVEAGVLSGRLPEALDSLSRAARTQLDVRRRIGMSLIYPAILLIVLAGLVAVISPKLAAGVRGIYNSGPFGIPAWLERMSEIIRSASMWAVYVPIAVIALALVWWLRSRSVTSSGVAGAVPLGWLPVLGGVRRSLRLAVLADTMGLLTSQSVPLPKAWRLAGGATGSSVISETADRIASRIERGDTLSAALADESAIPKLFRDVLISAERLGALPMAFREFAGICYRRAENTADWLRMVLPLASIVGLCGTLVAAYALSVFGPILQMMYDVCREVDWY